MKTIKLVMLVISIVAVISLSACSGGKSGSGVNLQDVEIMTLSSPTVEDGESLTKAQVFNDWGCTGENISPQLTWSDIPEGTKSFAAIMYDPDAPTGSGWWHWMMINIPANVTTLPAGAGNLDNKNLPVGAMQVTNDFGYKGFGGACPPADAEPHNYLIAVYALGVEKLNIPENAMPALAGYFIHQNVIGKAEIIAPSSLR